MIKKIADEIIRQEKKEEVIAYISESWSQEQINKKENKKDIRIRLTKVTGIAII